MIPANSLAYAVEQSKMDQKAWILDDNLTVVENVTIELNGSCLPSNISDSEFRSIFDFGNSRYNYFCLASDIKLVRSSKDPLNNRILFFQSG